MSILRFIPVWILPLMITFSLLSTATFAQVELTRDGKPVAQIIIAPDAPRAVPVAAAQLQEYIEKISGAKLPIVTSPDDGITNRIYVGQSQYTHSLGIEVSDLKYGGYRYLTGDNWVALVGNDQDYVFKGPNPTTRDEVPAAQDAWDKITGEKFRLPYSASPQRHYNKQLNLWYMDEKGSVFAVYGLLHDLGCRWYLPGELGEVVPTNKSITIPKTDRTVKPDFAFRYPHSRMAFSNPDEALWAMRMGWHLPADLVGPYSGMGVAHGMTSLLARPEAKVGKEDYYAMIGGKRFIPDKNPSYCLSNPKLLEENVKFLRAVFDTYDPWMVSVHPADGAMLVCQCPLCEGKATPERGRRGVASDYVWDYVNRVAKELYKTHPNKKIAGLAYANYQLPPEKIDQLSPNIIIGAPTGRTFYHNNASELKLLEDIRNEWLSKLPEGSKQIYYYEYFMDARPGRRTQYLPVVAVDTIAKNLHDVQGISIGDHIDVERYRENMTDLSTLHLNLLVTSRFWWDADTNLDELLADYYVNYYGPAAKEMKAVIEYAQAHWTDMARDPQSIETFLTLLDAGKSKVDADSVYGKRIGLIVDYTAPLRDLKKQQEMPRDASIPPIYLRGPRPELKAGEMTIDGKLDERVWHNTHKASTPEHLNLNSYHLKDLITGEKPRNATSFKIFWGDDALYLAIRCEDSDMPGLRVGSEMNDDNAIWRGDLIELHIETQSHSYYAIVINPAGAVTDLDWKNKIRETLWNSNAQVATQRYDDHWTIEMRIPIISEMDGDIVELGTTGVVGTMPTLNFPWYMNLIRQRLRDPEQGGNEFTAYSPLGKKGFHDPSKFARLSKPK